MGQLDNWPPVAYHAWLTTSLRIFLNEHFAIDCIVFSRVVRVTVGFLSASTCYYYKVCHCHVPSHNRARYFIVDIQSGPRIASHFRIVIQSY